MFTFDTGIEEEQDFLRELYLPQEATNGGEEEIIPSSPLFSCCDDNHDEDENNENAHHAMKDFVRPITIPTTTISHRESMFDLTSNNDEIERFDDSFLCDVQYHSEQNNLINQEQTMHNVNVEGVGTCLQFPKELTLPSGVSVNCNTKQEYDLFRSMCSDQETGNCFIPVRQERNVSTVVLKRIEERRKQLISKSNERTSVDNGISKPHKMKKKIRASTTIQFDKDFFNF